MESSDFPLPDEILKRAASAIPRKKGEAWGDLFAERTETLRADWEEGDGLRILPGIREGWAVRTVLASHQEHCTVEGLAPERLLAFGRSGSVRRAAPKAAIPAPQGFPWAIREKEKAVGATTRSLVEDLSRRIPGPVPFSLSLLWRRRS